MSFEIPNIHGRFLGEILKPFRVEAHNWWIGGEESYIVSNEGMEPLFPESIMDIGGEVLRNIIENNDYYLIFQDMKAFPKTSTISEINTYSEFVDSDCALTLLVVDSSYITVYCKDIEVLEKMYINAKEQGYLNLNYIMDKNDFRTRLSVW